MYDRLIADMDIDAGPILGGKATVEDIGGVIFEKLIAVASGEASKSESQGLGDYEFRALADWRRHVDPPSMVMA